MNENTIVCLSSYYKGYDFMDELKKLGNRVLLITSESLKEKNWPWHAIDEVYYMPEIAPSVWENHHLILGMAYLMRKEKVAAVVALDDYDVEKAALLRETFRVPGMGQTTHRYFRDKLAMRQKAKDSGISIPEFTAVFNDETVREFTEKVPAPWVLKPRSEASASGIKKIDSTEELWAALANLGEERYLFLLESYKPGEVFHVDSLVYNGKIIFANASQYLAPPMEVSHQGGIFRTKTLDKNSEENKVLQKINHDLLTNFGLLHGASHSEFIKAGGKYYFLETSSRVGGAFIPDMVEAATGINIWREWAKLEDALLRDKRYELPPVQNNYGGLIVALAKDRHPDTAEFQSPEIYKFLDIDYHIAMVFKAGTADKIMERIGEASSKITDHILNIIPPTEKPTH